MDNPDQNSKEQIEAFQEAQKLLMAFLPIYDSYHNQKENMAYLAATLYLAGASTLYFQRPFWGGYGLLKLLALIAFLLLFSALVFFFVRQQFKLRRAAGHMFRACSDLLSEWLKGPPERHSLEPDDFGDDGDLLFSKSRLPKALIVKIKELKRRRESVWWARDITFAVMVLAGGSVLARILYVWLKAKNYL